MLNSFRLKGGKFETIYKYSFADLYKLKEYILTTEPFEVWAKDVLFWSSYFETFF